MKKIKSYSAKSFILMLSIFFVIIMLLINIVLITKQIKKKN